MPPWTAFLSQYRAAKGNAQLTAVQREGGRGGRGGEGGRGGGREGGEGGREGGEGGREMERGEKESIKKERTFSLQCRTSHMSTNSRKANFLYSVHTPPTVWG